MILPCVFVVLFKIGKAPKLRARSLLEIQETRPQERERGKAEVMDEAQRKIFWRKEEEKIRELQFRREVKRHGYTKDPEFPGNLSWTDHNASGFIYREPSNHFGRGIRRGGQDVYLTSPLPLTGPSTIRR